MFKQKNFTYEPRRGIPLDLNKPISEGLIHASQFNEGAGTTAYDPTDFPSDGTLTNGPTWGFNQIGQHIDFDGADQYVRCVSDTIPDIDAVTISAYINLDTVANLAYVFRKGFGADPFITILWLPAASAYRFYVRDGSGTVIAELDTVTVGAGEWWHLVATWDKNVNGGKPDIWGNSVKGTPPVSGVTNTIALGTTGTDLYIAQSSQDTDYTNGKIGFLHIWDRRLSLNEIEEIFYNPYAMYRPQGFYDFARGFGYFDYGLPFVRPPSPEVEAAKRRWDRMNGLRLYRQREIQTNITAAGLLDFKLAADDRLMRIHVKNNDSTEITDLCVGTVDSGVDIVEDGTVLGSAASTRGYDSGLLHTGDGFICSPASETSFYISGTIVDIDVTCYYLTTVTKAGVQA